MKLENKNNTARSWDSFKPTLIKVLSEFNPQTVLEYGPGVSTLLLQDYPSVKLITTVEHDIAWFNKWKGHIGSKVFLNFEPDLKKYPYVGTGRLYDLYFIDGREREICLDICNRPEGIIMIHDAERESYKPYIDKYKYIFMEDAGHTAVLTNVDKNEARLERIFAYRNSPG